MSENRLIKRFIITDLHATLERIPAALYFAWTDTKARYRRSTLGPFWITLGTAVGVAGLGYLWAELLKVDRRVFVPSLTVGLIVWQLISSCITDATINFSRNAHIIRNMEVPFIFFPLQSVMRQLVTFLHNLVVIVAVLVIFNIQLSFTNLLLTIVGIIILILNLLWISLFLGILGARFRDVEPLISAIMPIMFFLSPVIYRPEYLSKSSMILVINPFSYFISIIRNPLLGISIEPKLYVVSILIMIFGWFISLILLNRKYSQISYWV